MCVGQKKNRATSVSSSLTISKCGHLIYICMLIGISASGSSSRQQQQQQQPIWRRSIPNIYVCIQVLAAAAATATAYSEEEHPAEGNSREVAEEDLAEARCLVVVGEGRLWGGEGARGCSLLPCRTCNPRMGRALRLGGGDFWAQVRRGGDRRYCMHVCIYMYIYIICIFICIGAGGGLFGRGVGIGGLSAASQVLSLLAYW